jgi:hypothetical protein
MNQSWSSTNDLCCSLGTCCYTGHFLESHLVQNLVVSALSLSFSSRLKIAVQFRGAFEVRVCAYGGLSGQRRRHAKPPVFAKHISRARNCSVSFFLTGWKDATHTIPVISLRTSLTLEIAVQVWEQKMKSTSMRKLTIGWVGCRFYARNSFLHGQN